MKRLKPTNPDPVFMDDSPFATDSLKEAMDTRKAARAEHAQSGTTPPANSVPSIGVHPNVPFEVYVSWKALNHSTLRKMERSAAHYRYAMDNPSDDSSPSKEFGTASHEFLFEPERAIARIVPAPINERTGNPFGRDTKAWAEYAAAHQGGLILTEDEIVRIRAMMEALTTHESVAPLLLEPSMSECCIVWDDDITGLRCKARIDRLIPSWGRIDLKTTRAADHNAFRKSLLDYGYGTQDAFYEMGVKALRDAKVLDCKDRSAFVAIESEPPHGVGVFVVGDESLGIARNKVREWLLQVKQCAERGVWPSYPSGVQTIDYPSWYFKQFADDEA